jgi:hypothetical protein
MEITVMNLIDVVSFLSNLVIICIVGLPLAISLVIFAIVAIIRDWLLQVEFDDSGDSL